MVTSVPVESPLKSVKVTKPVGIIFVAEAPEQMTTRRPTQRPAPTTAETWRAAQWPRHAKRVSTLPETGTGKVILQISGCRVIMKPQDQNAALMLDALRLQAGVHWDKKRKADVSRLDEAAHRGVSGFDSLRLMLEIGGVDYTVDSQAERVIATYRRRLRIQKLPIPRTIWVDDERPESVVQTEIDIVGARHKVGR